MWNFLGEKEAELVKKGLQKDKCLIGANKQIWHKLLQIALEGLKETGYEVDDDHFDDDLENSVAVRCSLLLSTLA